MQLQRKSVKCPICLHNGKTLLRDNQTVYRCLSCTRMVRVMTAAMLDEVEPIEAPKKKRGRKPKA